MSETDFLDKLGARVEISGSTGERRARPVLDAGRRGLDFFRKFGPPHARYTGTDHDFKRDFVRRYEAHADLVFGTLREDRERFASVDSGLFDSATSLRNQGEAVFGSWQRGAAEGIKARLARMLSTVDSLRAEFAVLGEVIGVVVDAADRAVYEKAAATRRLYADQVDGRSADDVKFLVDFHARVVTGDDVDDDEVARAVSLCGIKPLPSVSRNKQTLLIEATSAVDGWLRQVFAPAYEAKLAAFHDICTDADTKLAGCWRRLTDALGALHRDRLDPAPEVTPSVAASGPAGSGGGVGGGAGSLGGGTEPAPPPLAPGGMKGVGEAGGAAGLLGGLPMLGGVLGGADHDRRALDLPLAGVEFTKTPESVPVVGGQDDPATYNDLAQAATDAERENYEQLPVAGDDDLW